MSKVLVILTMLFCTGILPVSAQLSEGSKHVLAFEAGMWNRGLVGASYQRLYVRNNRFIFGGGGGVGIGRVPFGGGVNQFYYLTFLSGIGFESSGDQFFLGPGLDLKYVNFYGSEYDSVANDYVRIHSKGFGPMPYLGLNIRSESVFVQMRYSPFFIIDGRKMKKIDPGFGIGVTLGYEFSNVQATRFWRRLLN